MRSNFLELVAAIVLWGVLLFGCAGALGYWINRPVAYQQTVPSDDNNDGYVEQLGKILKR